MVLSCSECKNGRSIQPLDGFTVDAVCSRRILCYLLAIEGSILGNGFCLGSQVNPAGAGGLVA